MRLTAVLSVAALTVLTSASGLRAASFTLEQSMGGTDADWCKDIGDSRDSERFCEVRELTMAAPSMLDVNTSNGSVAIDGGARTDLYVRTRVVATGRTMADAQALAAQVSIESSGGRLRADGPRSSGRSSWWVSYRIAAPKSLDVRATSSNGSVAMTGVSGTLRAETSNGSVRLTDVAGDVRAETSNGSVHVVLTGTTWSGAGLEATTSNGSLRVDIPDDYNAHLIASSHNGSLTIDRPITMQGRIGREIDTTLGKGGPTLRLRTSNGSLRVGKR